MGQLLDPFQTNFTSGEIDRRLRARLDVAHYYSGVEYLRNIQILAQGGGTRRPGSLYRGTIWPVLQLRDISGMTVTAPNGGTVANLYDDDTAVRLTTTTNIGTVNPYVIAKVDAGAGSVITPYAVDLRNFYTSGGAVNAAGVEIQYSSDDVTYTTFGAGGAFDSITTSGKNYRRSTNTPVSARYWRVARIGATDLGVQKFELGELEFLEGTATLSNVKLIPFKFSTVQNYLCVATDRALAIYRNGVFQESVAIPHLSAQIADINHLQSLDTLHIFHKDVQPWRIERNGAHDEWVDLAQVFSNIIQYDFGAGAENVWSATRGWPRCGTYHLGRLYVGGSDQRPQTWWASKSGSFFDFNKGTGLDDEAFEGTLDTDDVATILNFNSGRHLQCFTTSAEFYFLPDKSPITPGTVDVRRTTTVGSEDGRGMGVVNVEGAVLFVQREGRAVHEFIYTDLENPYQTVNISLLSSHLIRTPVDFAIRKATSTTEGDLVLVVNTDGTLAVLNTLRSQEITGWSMWHTDGNYIAANVDFESIYAVVDRTIGGSTVRYLEEFSDDAYTDCAIQVTTGLPAALITGLDHIEGGVATLRLDSSQSLSKTVVSGQVTAEREAETIAEAGLAFPDCKELVCQELITIDGLTEREARIIIYADPAGTPTGEQVWIKDNPVDFRQDGTSTVGKLKRVVEADIPVHNTVDLYVGANNRPSKPVSFRGFGPALLDEPPPKFTGDVEVRGLQGYTKRGQLELSQRGPHPLHVLGISKRVSL